MTGNLIKRVILFSSPKKNLRVGLLFFVLFIFPAFTLFAKTATNHWPLTSPDGQCAITVSLDDQGDLSYQALRAGKIVIQKSPLGLRRDDEGFEHALTFEH